jgi:8-oxo-dGTP pyrophosphatase MutT (NUDIX family)
MTRPCVQRRLSDKYRQRFRRAKYRQRFRRANTIVIGDTNHDVAAGHSGGAHVVAVANGNHDVEQPSSRHPPLSARPLIAAGALFCDDHGRVMLVRPTYKPHWDIPGGYVEPGESPYDACVREVGEELGITPPLGGLLVVDWAPTDKDGDSILYIFDGGTLTDDDLSSIAFLDGELDEYQYLCQSDINGLAPPRLARRIYTALDAKHRGHAIYAEHGRATPLRVSDG